MDNNYPWFIGGVIIMAVLGLWAIMWYQSVTRPVIVPYVAPSPIAPLRSGDSINDSVTPSISPEQSGVVEPNAPANVLFDQPSEDTPVPTVSLPLSGSPTPSVFPQKQ